MLCCPQQPAMASILRQIVAGPRARHPEAGLDLCYVTDYIIATYVSELFLSSLYMHDAVASAWSCLSPPS